MTDVVWQGSEDLRRWLVPVADLTPSPRNPRRGNVEELAASLRRFGQVKPIVVMGSRVIAGHHIRLAAQSLGWTHIAAVDNEFADEEEARAYLLADNRIPGLGGYDEQQRLALLEDLERIGRWEGTGYTIDVLEDLRAIHGTIPTTAPEPFEGDYALSPDELAARAARLAEGTSYDEIVLTVTAAERKEFDTHVGIVRRERKIEGGVAEAVLAALAGEAERAA